MKKTVPQIHFKRRRLNGSAADPQVVPVGRTEPAEFAPEPPRPNPLRRKFGSAPKVKHSHSHNDKIETLREQLRSVFPAVFGARLKPLKVGIHKDIWQRLPEVDHSLLDTFLSKYTRQTDYLRALANGGQRYDLDGHVVEPISSFAITQSTQRLAGHRRSKE